MFEKVIGNDRIKQQLINSINNNKISHSYLFVGIEGIGKKMIAKEFAKALLCLDNNKYCNNCKSCIEFDGNNNPDFLYIEPEGNSIKIEQIRYLQKRVQEKPIISNNKICIIDNADSMTVEAQNCLLKTLEEPPAYVTIILIGRNENDFLTTIKSRCMIIHFNAIENNQIKNYLLNTYNMNNVNENMLEIFQGSIGKAIELKDKEEQYFQIEKIVDGLDKLDIIEIIKMSELLYKSKEEIDEILEYMNILLLKKAKDNFKYTKCIEIVENTKKRLKKNANFDMSIDNMLFNIWEEIN